MSQEVLTELVQALERGDEVALVTIVAAQGSTPQRVGAKMLVYPDGRISGTIGGGCYENDWLHKADIPQSSYVVVVTRGHRHDLDALRSLAARDLRYIGLIGSKAKVKKIFDALVEEGMPIECLSRIHAPIGLDIGAVSPEEIAVSILAELIAVRRGRMEEPHVAAASLQWKKLPASLAKE